MARTGRRPGPSTTREAILRAARARFAQAGFDGTSLRAIAADANVDTGVVQHFFRSKDELFRTVVGWPFDPSRIETELLGGSTAGLAGQLARMFFTYWENPNTGPVLAAVLRSATTHLESATLLREFVTQQVFGRAATRIDAPDADLRVELAAGQLIGVAMLRYILHVEPVASASIDDLVSRLEPVLDRHLRA